MRQKVYCDRFDFRKADWPKFRATLEKVCWSELFLDRPIDDMWASLRSIILHAAAVSIPRRSHLPQVFGVPLTGDVRAAYRRRKKIFRAVRDSTSLLAVDIRKEADDRLKAAITHSRISFEHRIADDCLNNPRRFWSYVCSSLASKPRVTSVFTPDGLLSSSKFETAEAFNNFFASVFTRVDESNSNIPDTTHRATYTSRPKFDNLEVSFEAVANIFSALPSCSSPGPDAIPNILLKEGGPSLIAGVVLFFRELISRGTLPKEWRTGFVIPIFKKGSRSECSNYRPITLTCSICKVFERLLKDSLLNYMYKNRLLKDSQHGFLP